MILFWRGEKTQEEPSCIHSGENPLETDDEAGPLRVHAGRCEQTMGIPSAERSGITRGSVDEMEWLRYYTKTLESRKVQELEPVLFKAWINLLCVARLFDGALPSCDEIGFRLRCSPEQAGKWIAELVARGFIEANELGQTVPHDWDEHQYDSDDVTERVRKHRAKRVRNVSCNVSGNDIETPLPPPHPPLPTEYRTDTDTESSAFAGTAPSITRKSDLVKSLPEKQGRAPIPASNGDLPKYFSEWIKPWLQCADPDGACRAWISTVETPADKEGAFASRDRYLASEQVQRGVWMEPKNFLFQQKTSNWAGKWPAPTVAAHKLTPSEEAIEYAKKRRAAK